MFGYVRPVRDELKGKDFDLYRATYCGLCRCMRRACGPLAPLFLNFDFTFLALLLWEPEERFTPCTGRCCANPAVKKPMCPDSPALELAARESMILAWWKLRDSVSDNGFWKGMSARSVALTVRTAYRRAANICPDFDRAAREQLALLAQLERENCPSMDRAADAFAGLLRAAAPKSGDPVRDRALEQLLYHLGRWIYLIDARDDLAEDLARRPVQSHRRPVRGTGGRRSPEAHPGPVDRIWRVRPFSCWTLAAARLCWRISFIWGSLWCSGRCSRAAGRPSKNRRYGETTHERPLYRSRRRSGRHR